jgi:aminoglycoside 6'-N-acetyltransferase
VTQLRGSRVGLRRAGDTDAPALLAVLADPEVARWWGDFGDKELRRDIRRRNPATFVIEVEGQVAGLLQYYEELDPEYRHAGLDIALATPWQDKGLGTDALRTMARYLFEKRGHHRLTIDPAVANQRAIAAYRKVGFQPVGVMRKYERGRDGTWHDGLLMDLLRDEFARP